MKTGAVVFDLWGTLVPNFSAVGGSDLPPGRSAFAVTLEAMADAAGAPREQFIELWGDTFDERSTGVLGTMEATIHALCRRCGVEPSRERVSHASRIRHDLTLRSLVPRPDAVTTLRRIRDLGIPIGMISDCTPDVPLVWAEMAMAALIDVPIFSCVARMKKPNPRIYHRACDGLGVRPETCLYVGDGGGRELTGATQVGMTALLLRDDGETFIDPYRVDAHDWRGPVVSSLEEVLGWVVD